MTALTLLIAKIALRLPGLSLFRLVEPIYNNNNKRIKELIGELRTKRTDPTHRVVFPSSRRTDPPGRRTSHLLACALNYCDSAGLHLKRLKCRTDWTSVEEHWTSLLSELS